jgi:type II secretory pathway pseudopilin PulG
MKSKAGFTLVHMLAAIAVIGLAVTGISQATIVVGRYQAKAGDVLARSGDRDAVQRSLDSLTAQIADNSTLVGAPDGLVALCGAIECSLALAGGKHSTELRIAFGSEISSMRTPGPATFAYQTDKDLRETWPTADLTETLRAIVLLDEAAAPIAVARLRETQTRDCEYDAIIRDCRAPLG